MRTKESFSLSSLGEGRGEGLSVSSFAPSPNPSQREGKKPETLSNNLIARLMLLTAPQLHFVFQIDSMFILNALANLLSQGQSVFGPRIVAFGDDKVCVLGRNYGATTARSLHSQIVDHFAGTDR